MKFAAVIEYTPDKAKIEEVRPVHRQYLTDLQEKRQLVCGGPFMDDSGALIIYEAETAAAAEALVKGDPFCNAGVFVRWTLRPWKTIFANPELFAPMIPPPSPR